MAQATASANDLGWGRFLLCCPFSSPSPSAGHSASGGHRVGGMIEAVVFDVGETLTSDNRYWAAWADWLDVPRHTLSALVGAVVAQGRANADAVRLLKPGIDLIAEYAAREEAGRGERLDESDLYPDVRPALFPACGRLPCSRRRESDRAAHVRRGPWGHLWAAAPEAAAADWHIEGLGELLPLVSEGRTLTHHATRRGTSNS